MKLPIIFITALCFFTEFSYASGCSASNTYQAYQEPCEPFDVLHEIGKIPKFNSAKHSVIAKYCLHYKIQKDSTMELLLYERVDSLPISAKYSVITKYSLHYKTQKNNTKELVLDELVDTLPIKKHKGCNSYSVSGNVNLNPSQIFSSYNYGSTSGSCLKTCTGSKEACKKYGDECKVGINEMLHIYDHINFFDINSCLKGKEGMEKISHLFNRYLPIKWDLEIYCELKEKIPIFGSHYIYISEVCSEEQLKKNKEYGDTGHP
jgi:hypothetical protein